MVVINRRVGLPLSQGRGHGLDFFSARMAYWVSKSMFVEGALASPPWGRRERGLVATSP